MNDLTLSWHFPPSCSAGVVAVGGRLGSWGLAPLARAVLVGLAVLAVLATQATQGAECPSVTQLGAPGGRMDAWSSVPLGPVSTGPGASSGGMAAASPSRATAQPGWPGHAGHPSFFTPFLPDVLMEAARPPAKGWVTFLWFPEGRDASSPQAATGASAQPGCTRCLPGTTGRGSFAKHWGHTRIYLSLAHPRGKGDGGLALDGTHGSLPLLPLSLLHLCLGWLRKISGFWQCEATGKPPNPLLRSLGTTPALTRSRGTPSHPGTTHASTPKPSWDAECRI